MGVWHSTPLTGVVARFRSMWRGLRRRDEVEAEMVEEFRHHIELRAEDLVARGMAREEAARQARLEFGPLEALRDEARASRGLHKFDQIRFSWLDAKLGARMLAKYPGLTLVGGFGLAVGVAVSVGFFTILRAYVYPALPLDEGDSIVALENRDVRTSNEDRRVLHDFLRWREQLHTVEQLGAFRTVARNLIPGDGPPVVVQVAEMTASGFSVARVPPLLGRTLVPADEQNGARPAVVIGHDVWLARFGGDPAAVGKELQLGGTRYTIVGVMPKGFYFPENHQYWIALPIDPNVAALGGPEVYVFGRLAPGIGMSEAQAELSVSPAEADAGTDAMMRPMVMPYTQSLADVQGISAWQTVVMQLFMTLLLLVVAANVAVLFYARTATRRGEITVRAALGASRLRIAAQFFAEALVLALVAAGAGLLLAQVGVQLGYRMLDMETEVGTPFWVDHGLQPLTVLFTVGLAVFSAVIIGVVPAFQATGRELQSDLRQLGGGTGMRLGRTWTALVVAQVAMAVAVLPNLLADGWSDISKEWATRPTYSANQFLVAELSGEEEPGSGATGFGETLKEVLRRLELEPDVAGASFRATLPGHADRVVVDGVPAPPTSPSGYVVRSLGGDADLLDLFDARLLAGRALGPVDTAWSAGGVVVTESFVRRVLGGGEAVGRRLRWVPDSGRTGPAEPERWHTIVGVVANLRTNSVNPDSVPSEVVYAVSPEQVNSATLAVRLRGPERTGVSARMREIVVSADPGLRLGRVFSLADTDRQGTMAAQLIALALISVLIAVLLLSAAGVYAMTSFAVTRRRREIGIRSALGATPRQVVRTMFSRVAAQVAIGVTAGMLLALIVDRLVGGIALAGRTALLVPLLAATMAVVATLATVGPARRGLGVPIVGSLREE